MAAIERKTKRYPTAALLKAEQESHRLMREWCRLGEMIEHDGEQEAIQCVIDHANDLLAFIFRAPVKSLLAATVVVRAAMDEELGVETCGESTDPRAYDALKRVRDWLSAASEGEPNS